MSTDTVPAEAERTPPTPPKFDHVFTGYLTIDVANFRAIPVAAGSRMNMAILSGYFEAPDGTRFAKLIPGVGGDHCIVDTKGIFHPDVRFTVEFDDGKFGYVVAQGKGVLGVGSELFITIETDSEKYADLVNRPLYAPVFLTGDIVRFVTWRPVRPF